MELRQKRMIGIGIGVAIGALGLAGMGAASRRRANTKADAAGINPVVPPRVMTEAQLNGWAAAMGTTPEHAVLMAMIASERPGRRQSQRAEQLAIISTAVNRSRWPRDFRMGNRGERDMWTIVAGRTNAPFTTGQQGGRQYATSRPPKTAADVVHYFGLVDEVLRNGTTTDATHFHHYKRGQMGIRKVDGVDKRVDLYAYTNAARKRQGYDLAPKVGGAVFHKPNRAKVAYFDARNPQSATA